MVEVGTVGNEGMSAVPLVHGAQVNTVDAMWQIEGDGLRMPSGEFRQELAENATFADVMNRYAQGFLAQVAQSTACNRLHPVEQRLARWLLMTHDRIGHDELQLTQEFLSQMLGVRRATVSVAAGALQRAGLISYSRGQITIVDREGLEQASCECYQLIRDEFDRLVE